MKLLTNEACSNRTTALSAGLWQHLQHTQAVAHRSWNTSIGQRTALPGSEAEHQLTLLEQTSHADHCCDHGGDSDT